MGKKALQKYNLTEKLCLQRKFQHNSLFSKPYRNVRCSACDYYIFGTEFALFRSENTGASHDMDYASTVTLCYFEGELLLESICQQFRQRE